MLVRQSLLAAPGFFAHGVIVMTDGQAFFAHHMTVAQTVDVTSKMFAFTLGALVASHCGFALGSRRSEGRRCYPFGNVKQAVLALYAGHVIALTGGYLFAAYALPVWEASYGANAVDVLPVNNLNVAVILGLSISFAALGYLRAQQQRINGQILVWILIAAYSLIWVFLFRGRRMEVLNGFVSIGLTAFLFHPTGKLSRRAQAKLIGGTVLVLLVSQLWGAIRDDTSIWLSRAEGALRVFERNSEVPLKLSTIGDVSATFAGTLYFVEHGGLETQWGAGYLNYIPRSVPGFLWANRPEDESILFTQSLGETSGGGFFELAEAYYNFGIVGVVIIPFVLSFSAARLFSSCRYQATLLNYLLLWGVLGSWWRGAWYQTFAFWRGITTAFIIYIALVVALELFVRGRRKTSTTPNRRPIAAIGAQEHSSPRRHAPRSQTVSPAPSGER